MAVIPNLRWPDPVLAQVCAPVDPAGIWDLAADMLDTMYAAGGRGLAAPQVGALHRLFVMDATWKDGAPQPMVLVNPAILWRSAGRAVGPEGCLSIPDVVAQVSRSVEVLVEWVDLEGDPQDAVLTGFAAICAQHEIDHLDGIVTLDHLTPEQRAEALA